MQEPPQSLPKEGVLAHLGAIDECFAHDSAEEIHAALEDRGDDWARGTLKLLRGYAEHSTDQVHSSGRQPATAEAGMGWQRST